MPDVPVKNHADTPNEPLRVHSHAFPNPLKDHADQRVLIKRDNNLQIRFRDLQRSGPIPHKVHHNVPGKLQHVCLHPFTPGGMIKMINGALVFKRKVNRLQKAVDPGFHRIVRLEDSLRFFPEDLFEQRVDVAVIVVKCVSVDLTAVDNILDSDLIQRPFV